MLSLQLLCVLVLKLNARLGNLNANQIIKYGQEANWVLKALFRGIEYFPSFEIPLFGDFRTNSFLVRDFLKEDQKSREKIYNIKMKKLEKENPVPKWLKNMKSTQTKKNVYFVVFDI